MTSSYSQIFRKYLEEVTMKYTTAETLISGAVSSFKNEHQMKTKIDSFLRSDRKVPSRIILFSTIFDNPLSDKKKILEDFEKACKERKIPFAAADETGNNMIKVFLCTEDLLSDKK